MPRGPALARICLIAEDQEQARLRALLGEGFCWEVDPQIRCDLYVFGPCAIAAEGTAPLQRLRRRAPRPPAIAIVADGAETALVRECFRAGASDVIHAGEVDAVLERIVRRVLEDGEVESLRMAQESGSCAGELESALQAVRDAYDQTLAALVEALDHRERETACHSQRVAVYAVLLGMRVGVDGDELEDLYRGALLHDIGKIGIPDSILLNPGRLDEEEWKIMRTHVDLGAALVGTISFLQRASDVPLAHHEAWDGSGYPRGLAGTDIPLHARIFAVVDSYDAIRSERSYKPAKGHEEALELLADVAGERLDPELVRIFAGEPDATWDRLAIAARRDRTYSEALRVCEQL